MSTTAIRDAAEYESRLQKYYFERAEEARAVRVGEKEVSEQAAIVARYRDLFTRPQIEALREAEDAASGEDRERLYRLRKTCEAGVISAEIAEQEDALENAILSARVRWRDEEMPLRAAQARLAVLDAYDEREELDAEVTGDADPIARSEEEKGISLRELERVLVAAADGTTEPWNRLRDT